MNGSPSCKPLPQLSNSASRDDCIEIIQIHFFHSVLFPWKCFFVGHVKYSWLCIILTFRCFIHPHKVEVQLKANQMHFQVKQVHCCSRVSKNDIYKCINRRWQLQPSRRVFLRLWWVLSLFGILKTEQEWVKPPRLSFNSFEALALVYPSLGGTGLHRERERELQHFQAYLSVHRIPQVKWI